MSIYATLWEIKIPTEGHWADGPYGYVEIHAQAVPPHIGHPSDYPEGDPYAAFLPPPVQLESTEEPLGQPFRAVFICAPWTKKGTARSGQEYTDYVLMLTGEEYMTVTWQALLERIFEAVQEALPKHMAPWCPECGKQTVRQRRRGRSTTHTCTTCTAQWRVIALDLPKED